MKHDVAKGLLRDLKAMEHDPRSVVDCLNTEEVDELFHLTIKLLEAVYSVKQARAAQSVSGKLSKKANK